MINSIVTLFAVLLGAFLTWFIDWFRYRRERKNKSVYVALRSVISLDRYIKGCAMSLSGHDDEPFWPDYENPFGNYTLPEKFFIPENVDWTSIPASLSYKILSIPQRDEEARAAVRLSYDVADGDRALLTRDESYLPIAIDAIAITRDLRKNYKLGVPERGQWNPEVILQELKDEWSKT